MSDRLGYLERKIINMLRYGRHDLPLDASDIAWKAYRFDGGNSPRAGRVAVLRAMGSVARKYPDIPVVGANGELVLLDHDEAPELSGEEVVHVAAAQVVEAFAAY